MKLKIIVPDIKSTFGKLMFSGKDKDVFTFDPITRQKTSILEARIYNLTSEEQGGEVQVIVPATVDEFTFGFMQEVEIINPKLTARAASKGSSFAELIWKCEVDTIRKKGVEAPLKNTSNTGANKV